MLPQKIATTLKEFYNIINDAGVMWILSGSASLVLQGVDVEVHDDIDILTDEEGALRIATLLAGRTIKASEFSNTDIYRSHFGVYEFDGIKVEVMGEFQYRLKDGSWSRPNQENEIIYLEFQDMKLPLLTLEQELIEYENLERHDKVKKIKARLNQ